MGKAAWEIANKSRKHKTSHKSIANKNYLSLTCETEKGEWREEKNPGKCDIGKAKKGDTLNNDKVNIVK